MFGKNGRFGYKRGINKLICIEKIIHCRGAKNTEKNQKIRN